MKTFPMNRTLKWPFALLAGLLCLAPRIEAALPPAEQLLPDDTLGMISVPDWAKASAYYQQSPAGQLWQDPALIPFKQNFLKQFKEDVVAPLERELGIKLADYTSLIQGQLTFAVLRNGWDGGPDKMPGMILLIDTKDKSDRLKILLTDLKKKWVDSGKQIKTERVRDVDFSTLLVRRSDLNNTLKKAFPASSPAGDAPEKPDGQPKGDLFEISFGQSESLLIIGNTVKGLEKILIRQTGGSVAALADLSSYEANHSAMFRDALVFGWIHSKPIYEILIRQAAASAGASGAANPMVPGVDKILAATGLGGLKTIAFKMSGGQEGSFAEVLLGVPESNRQGLFKILIPERKESAPPSFVPGDAVKFSRWRLDGQKAWATLEAMAASISPDMAGLIQMGLATVGKDKDPNFDLKKKLIGNLGDDFITFEKNPRSSTRVALSQPTAIFMIGSPNAEQLSQALKASSSILPAANGSDGLKEREFLGRKVYSIALPTGPSVDGSKEIAQSLNFAASGGYIALSADVAMLEEVLRSTESSGKTLLEAAGLNEAAQKVGGMSTGLFGYENQRETMRVTLETLKSDIARLDRILSLGDKLTSDKDATNMKDWFDVARLPAFDQIAKYFHLMVYSGGATSEGLSWKLFMPTPPQLK